MNLGEAIGQMVGNSAPTPEVEMRIAQAENGWVLRVSNGMRKTALYVARDVNGLCALIEIAAKDFAPETHHV